MFILNSINSYFNMAHFRQAAKTENVFGLENAQGIITNKMAVHAV